MDSYDDIAHYYDDLFNEHIDIAENRAIAAMLTPYLYNKTILDIGCGTGLLLELFTLDPKKYVGIDPSEKMLDIAREKFKFFEFRQEKFEHYIGFTDVAVSLFGSVSYIHWDVYEKITQVCNKYFLMFYKEDYEPKTYYKTQKHFKHYHLTYYDLFNGFPNAEILSFQNFYIVTNMFV